MNKLIRVSTMAVSVLAMAALGHVLAHDEHTPHFDAPQHGGVVLEFHDELHYELVTAQAGQELQVWLSDAHRRPLAASEVTDLVAEIGHAGNKVEQVDMHISADGGCWTGSVHLKDPADIVRIGFTYHMLTATGSMKYDSLLHPPRPPAPEHGSDHTHEAHGT